jgi:hypothetical protein
MATEAEQQAAARRQIQGQAELGQAAPMQSRDTAELGEQVASSGAGATEVDVQALLAQLEEFRRRIDAVEDDRAAERVKDQPGIVQRAELILAHLAHRHAAGSGFSVLGPAVEKAEALVDAAKAAVDSGDTGEALTLAGALSKHLTRVGPAAASVDVSYPQQLLDEDFPESAAAVRPARTAAPQPAAQGAPGPAPDPAGQPVRPARPGRTITF